MTEILNQTFARFSSSSYDVTVSGRLFVKARLSIWYEKESRIIMIHFPYSLVDPRDCSRVYFSLAERDCSQVIMERHRANAHAFRNHGTKERNWKSTLSR